MTEKLNKSNFLKSISSAITYIGVVVTFYFSWVDSPKLGYNYFVPNFMAEWVDKEVNYNMRTAVPLLIVGFFSGLTLVIHQKNRYSWVCTWLVLALLVSLAEIGQLFLPLRSFDIRDVFWGTLGAGFGLLLVFFARLLLKKKKAYI